MKFKRRLIIAGTVLGVLVIGFLYWLSRIQWIPAGYVGVVYSAQSGLRKSVYRPQALFVGPFEQLYVFPTKLQAAIYTQDKNWGEVHAADGIEITTSDSAITIFDVTILYQVRPEDVFTVFEKFGPIPIEEIQVLHLRRAVREAASAVGNRYDVFELLGTKREEASKLMTKEVHNRIGSKGITVLHAMLGSAHPSQSIADKITQRVNAYTQLEISKLESQIALVNRKSSVILAEAEASSRNITGLQTVDKSLEMLSLELESLAIDRWGKAGGKLPSVIVQPGQTVIVNGQGIVPTGGSR
jgi:regulator of protease activity HflC (stomatin/prohibitin superfamily)